MRIFISINLPKEIKDYLYELQNKLRKELDAKINWVAKSRFHLTLKFFGEIKETQLLQIKEKLNKIKFKSFEVKLEDMGVFPNEDYIKVIWVGLKPAVKVIELAQKIDSELLDSFSKEQEFSAHLTLGRVKFIKDKEKFKKNLKLEIEKKSFEIKEFSLMKSELSKDGPKYEVLEKYSLK